MGLNAMKGCKTEYAVLVHVKIVHGGSNMKNYYHSGDETMCRFYFADILKNKLLWIQQ